MRLKSYFASTVEAAMTLARQELGADAMLVHSKKAAPESRYLGEYEVVFAADPEPEQEQAPRAAEIPEKDPALDRLADDIGSLRRQVERIAAALGYATAARGALPFTHADAAQAFATLVRAGVYAEIAQEFVTKASLSNAGDLATALPLFLRDNIRTAVWKPAANREQRIAAFIGPPGSGKTTTIAKIAAAYGIATRTSTQVITTDVFRIAASEQMRTLCSILGVGFQCVETPLALEQTIAEHRNKELILIDTPGTAERDQADLDGFAHFLAVRPEVEKHLVLPASMKAEDLSRMTGRFERFGFTHLLFTKLDETTTFGCLLNELHRTRRPLSFLSGGQEVPEDLYPADAERLTALLLGLPAAAPQRASSAAA